MKKITKFLFLGYASLFLHGCKPLRTILNDEFPPLSTTDQQYISVQKNISELSDFQPHIGINIDKDFIAQYLPTEIKNAVDSLDIENVKIQKLEPKVSFDKQGIFVDADFSILIPKKEVEIKIQGQNIKIPKESIEINGDLNGVTAVSTESDSLYLRSALSSLNIKSIKFIKKPKLPKKALARLISPILKNYIENLNGAIFKNPTVIDTGWGQTYRLSVKEMFKDPNTEVIADSLKASRFIKKSSIRIKSEGVSVMIELIKEKPTKDIATTRTISPTTSPITNGELKKLFNTFDEKFDNSWLSVFNPIDVNSLVVANISKSEISNIFNEALSQQIILKQNFTIPTITFNEKFEVEKKDIDCQKVRTKFSYPDFNGASCNWHCRSWDLVCKASKEACKVQREVERVAWQLARETARVAHQAENEGKVVACNVWRETLGFLALGRFKGDLSGTGSAVINLKSFNFNSDLTEIALQYSGGVEGKLKANLELKPIDLGNIFFCFSDYEKKVSSNVDINIPEVTSKISINSTREGENLVLNIKLDKVPYNASINPSPLHSLLLDPQFLVQCPISQLVLLGGMSAAAGKFLGFVKLAPEQELLLLGNVSGSYGIDAIQIPFKPITFKINGEQKKSLIFWNSKSFQFTYFKS